MSNNKRIAKNTIFLYFRMILIMLVTLYTSRIILEKLGVEDFGLYNVVGGVVGMLAFLNNSLSTGTSRFITFSLGRDSKEELFETFNTAFYAHLGLGIILVCLLESLGIWFVKTHLLIPEERLSAALIVYHVSIITMLVAFTQVPYTADIIAHENMSIYAYVSIYEAVSKLAVVYLLSISPVDKLVFYALLIAFVQISVAFFYRLLCIRKYEEAHVSLQFNINIFKKILNFSGWNILANLVELLKTQGIVVLMNMFFLPAIVGAQALANQVSNAISQLVSNFRTAINPQIIKQYAAGNFYESQQLTLNSTLYCFDLILIISIPLIFAMEFVLNIWLVKVPDYAVIFAQWTLIQRIVGVIDASLYTPMVASARLKNNSIFAAIIGLIQYGSLYFIWNAGYSVMWVQYIGLIVVFAFSFFIKPLILCKEIQYKLKDIIRCFVKCICVLVLSLIIPLILFLLDPSKSFGNILLNSLLTCLGVIFASYITLDKYTKIKVNKWLKAQIKIVTR